MMSYKDYIWIGLIVLMFSVSLGLQWNGEGSIAVADNVHYILGGINLITTGRYTSPFGTPEIFFHPFYPILIGLLSFGGRVDPMIVGRLIAIVASLWCLVVVYLVSKRYSSLFGNYLPIIATITLACTSHFQRWTGVVMAEPLVTALSFTAFFIWESLRVDSSWKKYLCLGFLIGLASLTRPEPLILLPILIVTDRFLVKTNKIFYKHFIALFAFSLCVFPFAAYLNYHTDNLNLTKKGGVTLSVARAFFYGGRRAEIYYIDPDTLEISLPQYEVSVWSEVRRYLTNLGKLFITQGYSNVFRSIFWPIMAFLAVMGLVYLYKQRQKRLLFGLLSLFIYVPVISFYTHSTKYLYQTFPAMAVLLAVGISSIVKSGFADKSRGSKRWIAVLLLCFMAMALLESGSRQPRWALTQAPPEQSLLLRDVGIQLAAKQIPKGVLYEVGATVGYYSGQLRRRLTQDDLQTFLKHIDHVNFPGPVYLVVDSLHQYHPTIKELLSTESPDFPIIAEINDQRGRVRVFQVK